MTTMITLSSWQIFLNLIIKIFKIVESLQEKKLKKKCYLYWNYGCFLVLQKSLEGKIISAAKKKQNIKNIPCRFGSRHIVRHKQTNTNAKDNKDIKGTKMSQHLTKELPLSHSLVFFLFKKGW